MSKVTRSIAEINKEITDLSQKIEALNAAINRMNGDRDFLFQKRTLEDMERGLEKRWLYLKNAIKDLQVVIDI